MEVKAVVPASIIDSQSLSQTRALDNPALKKVYSPSDFYVKPGIPLAKNDEFINKIIFSHSPEEDTEPAGTAKKKNASEIKPHTVKKVIDGTKQVLSIARGVSGAAGRSDVTELIITSDGALTFSKGIINLADIKSEKNKTKAALDSASQLVSGIGVILSQIDVPEAEFLTLAGRALGFGVQQQTLTEEIEKKNNRGIAESSVSMVKSGWGITLSGVKAAKIAAGMGQSAGLVSAETVVKVTGTAEKVGNFASKIAIPFAVAGTGFRLWDLVATGKKITALKKETVSPDETNLKNISSLKTTAGVQAVAFGLSAVSTAALITSVVYPPSKAVASPVAIGSSILASVTASLSDEKLRDTIGNGIATVSEARENFRNKTMFSIARVIDKVIK